MSYTPRGLQLRDSFRRLRRRGLAYLTNYSRANPADHSPAGLLLHATEGHAVRYAYNFPGHRLEVRSLDLRQRWPDLRLDLHGPRQ